jgi:hypothetical protein
MVGVITVPSITKNPINLTGFLTVVRKKGLEPPRREAPDPKSGAATNYATSALGFLTGRKDSVLC